MVDLTFIARAVVTLLALLISTFLIPFIKTKISADKLEKLLAYVRIGVFAAEQIFRETGMGAKKKEYVANYLASLGYTLDQDELDALIESTVLEMKNELIA